MKRMHETDGPKTFYHNSYHNFPNHQHFNNHNNNNFANGGGGGGGYQHNNGGYHQNGYHNYRNNNFGHRNRFYKNRYNHHNNHHHHHQQYNNHHHHQFHCPVQHPQETIVPPGHISDPSTIPIPVPPTPAVMDQNPPSRPQFPPPVPPSTPCGPDSSASSVKSESNSACSEQEENQAPLPQTQQQPKQVPSPAVGALSGPVPANFPESYEVACKEMMALSDAIWKKYLMNQQSHEVYRKKMELWRELFDLFKTTHAVNYPRYSLQVVGSTMSGFGSRNSDVDVCLMIRRCEIDQRIEAVDRLHELQASLQKIPYMENIELIYAKVPILKFRDRSRNLDVDLNCNNSVGIRNTHLLFCYSQLDWRVKPLVLVVKLWAQFHGINDAKNMTISSYSLVLMVIHYLQFGCKEPVLPCLHQMYPEKFSPYLDVEKIKINEHIPKWDSHNTDCLGELLIGFLEYYARKFDYARAAVSVRLGCHVPIKLCMQTRSYKNDPHQWKYLCVEEPFDLTNTARSVYDKEAFDRIRGVFYASWQRLVFTRELESIFHTIPDNESRAIAGRLGPSVLR